MVVFTCSSCGQSVKKNQVENHCNYQCRNCESLSCMDCGKVFWGDDYKEHTKCITEDQKYGGKSYQPKPSSNKGEVKQEKWIEHVNNVIATQKLSGVLKNYLEQIVLYTNIPRKKSKFENFLNNSLKLRNPTLISQIWEIFAQSTSNETKSNEESKSPAVNINGVPKRKLDDREDIHSKKFCQNGINGLQKRFSDTQGKNSTPEKNSEDLEWEEIIWNVLQNYTEINLNMRKLNSEEFNWVEVMGIICEKCGGEELEMRELRRLVIATYKATVKDSRLSDRDLKEKFRKIVYNTDKFNVKKPQ